ncbi:23S rRNA (uracil(1939)-C(5))-methyltransferase RlmD [Alteromonas oceanisediminis]|uniref:23S rRNA (uracil(1939)-C(5))-methyltransferase RlmD n=1 Tax=Alteromonas oceanisediminis TaxID=2836180 RepID=UPI001BDA1EBC|nr:23S rRNA (uracil(1939)-C(5))-methyltransferase RlmD [Alteromonas oceanisediminis]MBT0585216.1 23S rRNA (uracil(1939)-C(5))-methyltransferase RlmD [Alteromonas oceanisediminis]
MVAFFKSPQSQRKRKAPTHQIMKGVSIDRLDHQGVGVSRQRDPVVLVEGALPDETVNVSVTQQKSRFIKASVTAVCTPSAARVTPFCEHSAVCGGCQLDYIEPAELRLWRQDAIQTLLETTANVEPLNWLAPITGNQLGYRRKARLATDARNPQQRKLGYRAAQSSQVFRLNNCAVLTPSLQALLKPLQAWFDGCDQAQHVGHITLLEGENNTLIQVRMLRPLADKNQQALLALAQLHRCVLVVERDNHRLQVLHGESAQVTYSPQPQLEIPIGGNDFVQVNHAVNQQMVAQVLAWLREYHGTGAKVLDLFCGTGNFSIPLARAGFHVQGIEGVNAMVQKASDYAVSHALAQCKFSCIDLNDTRATRSLLEDKADAVVLDPSREGAAVVCNELSPTRHPVVVYVSCNPASFARDAKALVSRGYRLTQIGLVEMFPYTKHSELISLFSAATAQ